MSTKPTNNSLHSALKKAEAANEPEAVVGALHNLLKDDFEKAAKTAISGARKHLTKGILCPAYRDAFWNAQTPIQFVEAFGTHPVWRWKFWKSCFAQPKLPLAVIRQALNTCPKALEEGLRSNEVFFDQVNWQEIKLELQDSQFEDFVAQCELIRDAAQNQKDNLTRFDELLRKIAPESIVIQFAAWLEQRYFEAEDGNDFEMRMPEHFEILESSLTRSCNLRASKREAKTPSDIGCGIKRIVKRITDDNSTQLDCYPLFEAIERQLDFDFGITLFAAHGAEALEQESRIHFRLTDPNKERAWEYTRWKFCAFDTFVTSVPQTEAESRRQQEIWEHRANDESAEMGFQYDAGLKLLYEYLGEAAYGLIKEHIGADPGNILTVLNCYKSCMQIQFSNPRKDFKKAGLGHHTSWLMPQSRQEPLTMLHSPKRWPMEPRPPEGMTELVANFFPGNDELKSEARTIFDLFAEDIYANNVSLQDKLLIKNAKCDLLLPRLWSGDVKTFLFNAAFQNQKIGQLAAANYEERIGSLFRAAEHQVIVGQKLNYEGRTEAEIDVLAYRDGTLFLIEAKMTYYRGRPQQVVNVAKALDKAGFQLKERLALLPNYWTEIAEKFGIKKGYEDTEVIPLIVSNSFEYDHLYFNGSLKVTDFELEMIFRNNPGITAQLALSHSQRLRDEVIQTEFQDQLATRISNMTKDDQKAFMEAYALNPLGQLPTAREFIEALENNCFWSKVLNVDFGLTPLRPNT
jgi:hypothetical protein